AARDRFHRTASRQSVIRLRSPTPRDSKLAARAVGPRLGQDLMRAAVSGDGSRRPFGLVPRLGIATMCMVLALGYASNSRQPAGLALSDPHDHASPNASGDVDPIATAALAPSGLPAAKAPASANRPSPDLAAAWAQVGEARAQATAAKQSADREHKAAEIER